MQTLDNPVWSALRSGHAHLCRTGGSALRYAVEVAPFAAVEREGEPVPASLLAPDESICFVGVLPRVCADWRVEEQAHVLQLTCTRVAPPAGRSVPWRALGEDDVPAMLDLTARVFPGYFRERTLAMGRYLGIFAADGRLVAMAGERMNLGDRCEISAVCTDPSRTGRGHAHQLVHALVEGALQRGTVPFLHVSPENARARHVYAALGFEPRATLRLLRVRRAR
jgi:ribosomal protein S18 acetylase RimI-like enzyme